MGGGGFECDVTMRFAQPDVTLNGNVPSLSPFGMTLMLGALLAAASVALRRRSG